MQKILISRCQDPRWNLALEEQLMDQGREILYLWQNEPSVIIGRNQDPYSECCPEKLQEDHIHLVRRKSGGGAVYHDLGNLNITILSTKDPDVVDKNFRFLRNTLRRLGLDAELSGRNDLEVRGRKISGSAFYETDRGFCHHCTMLVSVDTESMGRYLTPSPLKLQSRGIQSVRSRVANLSEICPGLTCGKLTEALIQEAGGNPVCLTREDMEAIPGLSELARRYGSWDWTFGESPKSNLTLEEKFSWGLVRAELDIVSGMVASCRIFTDSLVTEGFEELSKSLQGLPFQGEAYDRAVTVFQDPAIAKDLQKLFCKS